MSNFDSITDYEEFLRSSENPDKCRANAAWGADTKTYKKDAELIQETDYATMTDDGYNVSLLSEEIRNHQAAEAEVEAERAYMKDQLPEITEFEDYSDVSDSVFNAVIYAEKYLNKYGYDRIIKTDDGERDILYETIRSAISRYPTDGNVDIFHWTIDDYMIIALQNKCFNIYLRYHGVGGWADTYMFTGKMRIDFLYR